MAPPERFKEQVIPPRAVKHQDPVALAPVATIPSDTLPSLSALLLRSLPGKPEKLPPEVSTGQLGVGAGVGDGHGEQPLGPFLFFF